MKYKTDIQDKIVAVQPIAVQKKNSISPSRIRYNTGGFESPLKDKNVKEQTETTILPSFYSSPTSDFLLAHGDCFQLLKAFDFKFDMIFADPPYFLSNGGISLQNGKVVCVDKGEWDKG